jgi:hypothetical protein
MTPSLAAALLLSCIAPVFGAASEDPLADSRALTRKVQSLLRRASAAAEAGEESAETIIKCILSSSSSEYDTVLSAFEDCSHPLLQDDEAASHASLIDDDGVPADVDADDDFHRFALALKAERKRRRRAEAALDAALERARRAEKRYAVLLRTQQPSTLAKSKRAPKSRSRKL